MPPCNRICQATTMRRTAGIKNNIGTRVERREKGSDRLPPYLIPFAANLSASSALHSCQGAVILCPFRAISKGIKPSFFASRVALLSNAREQPSHAQLRVMIDHPRAALRAPTWPRSRGALAP